jgi:hypothetical protein
MDRGWSFREEKAMERQGCRGAVGSTAVRHLWSHRHLVPSHQGCRVQWAVCSGRHTFSIMPCIRTDYRSHSSRLSLPSTTAFAIPAGANTPPGVLTHAPVPSSIAYSTSSTTAPHATLSPLLCCQSAASSSLSKQAPSVPPTSAPLQIPPLRPSPPSNSLAS